MLQALSGRGLHPKLRASCVRAFCFDESTASGAACLIDSANNLAQSGTIGLPSVASADVGNARRFEGADLLEGIAPDVADFQAGGEFTIHIRLRMHANDWSASETVLSIAGDSTGGTSAENTQFELQVNSSSDQFRIFTESGTLSAATEDIDSYLIEAGVYVLLTIVGYDDGGMIYKVYANGRLIHTTSARTAPTGGGNAVLWVGGRSKSGNTDRPANVDVASLFIYNSQLTSEQIEEDARRAQLLTHFSQEAYKVETEDGNASTVDLTNHEGVSWVDTATISRDVDEPVATGTLMLFREQGNLSLAHLKTDSKLNLTDLNDNTSYDPLLDIMRPIEIFAGRAPLFVEHVASDYVSVLKGFIDDIDWSGDKVKVTCRDEGGRLVDTYIETENDLGTAETQSLEATIQQILDDNDNTAVTGTYDAITLYTPRDSQWVQLIRNAQGRQLKQRREPVMTAIRTHAGQIGWDCKYLYDPDIATPGWKLTLFEPERTKTAPDMLITPDEITNVSMLKVSAQRLRTDVRIVYPSSETSTPGAITLPSGITEVDRGWLGTDGEGNRNFAYIHLTNSASRTRYGRRFFEIAEAATSMIDTIDEAARMASSILLDLGEPDALYDFEMPLRHEVMPNDVIGMLSNPWLHTGTQQLAVRSVSHKLGRDGRTTMTMRGKPAVGFKRWMTLGTYPGQARPPTINPYNTLDDMTIGQLVPYVTGLIDRTQYFRGDNAVFGLSNFNFNKSTRGALEFPDGWSAWTDSASYNFYLDGQWVTDFDYDDSYSQSGRQSLSIISADKMIVSDAIPLPDSVAPILRVEVVHANGAAGSSSITPLYHYYDANGAYISTSGGSILTVNGTVGSWVRELVGPISVFPSNAAFIRVALRGVSSNFTSPHLVDSINISTLPESIYAESTSPSTTVSSGAWTTVTLGSVGRQWTTGGISGSNDYTFINDGLFRISASATLTAASGSVLTSANVRVQIDSGSGFVTVGSGQGTTYNSNTAPSYSMSPEYSLSVEVSAGDKVRVQGIGNYSSTTGSEGISGSIDLTLEE